MNHSHHFCHLPRCAAAEAKAELYGERLDEARATLVKSVQQTATAKQKQARLAEQVRNLKFRFSNIL